MKRLKLYVPIICAMAFAAGCNSTKTTTDNTSTAVANPNKEAAITGNTIRFNPETDTAAAISIMDTTSFPNAAASSNMFELMSSQEVQSRGVNPEVRKFAEQMITDHTQTANELKRIAASNGIPLPEAMSPRHQRMLEQLRNAKGKNFDEAYMDAQVLAHREAVTLFERASKNEVNPDLKAFAAKTLPTLKMHLDHAKKVEDMVDDKKDKRTAVADE